MRKLLFLVFAVVTILGIGHALAATQTEVGVEKADSHVSDTTVVETIIDEYMEGEDSVVVVELKPTSIVRLTEEDYIEVAEELGIEVPAIKAVVEIEAGKSHEGFSAPGVPLVNFDMSMYKQFARKRGINLNSYRKSHPDVFQGGKGQASENRQLKSAMSIDFATAVEGTFWGMFQIGGFNWKKCGVSSIEEFVQLMSRSERDQLELFAQFIKSTGLLKHLQDKNWSAFARGYNGPSYASRGYHTRMANAYKRYKSK